MREGGFVIRSIVSRRDGRSWASRRGRFVRWLWRFTHELDDAEDEDDLFLLRLMELKRESGEALGLNSNEESEVDDSDGHESGMNESKF